MAYGFQIFTSSGTSRFSTTDTTALLKEHIIETSPTSGSETYTDATGETAYAVGLCEGGGGAEGVWTSVDFGVSISADGSGNPVVSYDIVCNNTASSVFPTACSGWGNYHIFVFTR